MKSYFGGEPNQENSYPLATIPLSDKSSNLKRVNGSEGDNEELDSNQPGTPDSTTPLRNKKNIFDSQKNEPDRFSLNSAPFSPDNSHNANNNPTFRSPFSRKLSNFFNFSLIEKYLRFCWFLLKTASARTMTLPIGFYSSSSLEKDVQTSPILVGSTLWIFSPKNRLRRALAALFRSELTEVFLTLVVLIHWVTLLCCTWKVDEMKSKEYSTERPRIKIILRVVFFIYSLEALARIIVGGLIKNGIKFPRVRHKEAAFGKLHNINQRINSTRSAYLRRSFNRLDLFCIVCFWILTVLEILGYKNLFFLSALSSLRIFRLLNFISGSQVILKSLKASAPLLANVALLIGFFLLAYSILGTTFFRTSLKTRCFAIDYETNEKSDLFFERFCGSYINQSHAEAIPDFSKEYSSYSLDKFSSGYTCPFNQICQQAENPNSDLTSFDNLWESFIYVFIIGSGQSWSDIFYQIQQATTSYSSLYFLLVLLTLNFWLLNMFVAVITEVFANLRSGQESAFVNANSSLNLFEKAQTFENSIINSDDFSEIPESQAFKDMIAYLREKLIFFNNVWAERFWLVLVIVNMAILASRNYKSTTFQLTAYSWAEFSFSLLFCIEILIRCFLWSSSKSFLSDFRNRTDFILCILTISTTAFNVLKIFPIYRYFTIFQLLRAYRVVWAIPNVRDLLTKVAGSIMGIANMVVFVFIMIFLCCAVAMQIFGGTIPQKSGDETIFQRFDNIGWSFLALYQVFSGEDWSKVLFFVMEGQETTYNIFASVIFILLFFGLSNFILLNLFVAVLVENLEISESSKRKIQLEGYFEGLETNFQRVNVYLSPWNVYRYIDPEPQRLKIKGIPRNLILPVVQANAQQFLGNKLSEQRPSAQTSYWSKLKSFKLQGLFKSKRQNSEIELNQFTSFSGLQDFDTEALLALTAQNQNDQEPTTSFQDAHTLARDEFCEAHPTYDKSLFVFSRRSRLRRICQVLTGSEDHPKYPFEPFSLHWFANRLFFFFMVISVVLNVICTLYETPLALKDADLREKFTIADGVFLVIFSFDVSVNVIADGFLFSPNAYLLSSWNLIYFVALIISFIDYLTIFTQHDGLGRLTRAGKAFRVVRLINFSKTAKFTLHAVLVSGFWKLFDAASVAFCFLVPWAIYLQNVFSNRLYSCNDDDVAGLAECIGTFVDPQLGITLPRVWNNPWKYSFDTFFSSLSILFEITSGEGWTDVMENSMKISDIDLQPQEYNSPYNAIFFVTFNFMVSVSILSLFVSIVIDNFTTKSGSALLVVEQRRWKDMSKLLKTIEPPKVRRSPPGNPVVKMLYNLVLKKNSWLTMLMSGVYIALLIVLSTERVQVSQLELFIKSWIIFGLLLICLIEVSIRIIGMGPIVFFSNVWHLLYFIIVTVDTLLAAVLTENYQNRNYHNAVHFLSVLVALRCMMMFDGLHQLVRTLKASLRSIINLLFVWFILFLIYATIFIQVFGLTKVGVNGNTGLANFNTPVSTLMMLVRFSQGEAWNSVMYDYTIQEPLCVNDNPKDYESSDCGSPLWSYALFISFNVLSMYIFLNMFVGVIVDNFSYCYQLTGEDGEDSSTTSDMLSRNQTRSYKSAWIQFDPKRTGYLKPECLVSFLLSLSSPFNCSIYDSFYSLKTLKEGSFYDYSGVESQTRNSSNLSIKDFDLGTLNLKVLNSLLGTMNVEDCNIRRRRFNLIYHECLLFIKPGKGIQFTDVLLTLARHRLVDPNVAFEIGELIKYKKIKEQVYYRVSMEKVVGTLKTMVLRRRFLQHLEAKRSKKSSVLPEHDSEEFMDLPSFDGSSDPTSPRLQLSDSIFRRRGPVNRSNTIPESDDIDQDTAAAYMRQFQENNWAKLLKDKAKKP